MPVGGNRNPTGFFRNDHGDGVGHFAKCGVVARNYSAVYGIMLLKAAIHICPPVRGHRE